MATERVTPISDAVSDPASNVITINSDGTYTPAGGVSINAGGVAKFEVHFPGTTNVCKIPFGDITFEQVAIEAGGTVKVGS